MSGAWPSFDPQAFARLPSQHKEPLRGTASPVALRYHATCQLFVYVFFR